MTRMTGPDCAAMCNLINTHTHKRRLPFSRKMNSRARRHRPEKALGVSNLKINNTPPAPPHTQLRRDLHFGGKVEAVREIPREKDGPQHPQSYSVEADGNDEGDERHVHQFPQLIRQLEGGRVLGGGGGVEWSGGQGGG